MQQYLQMAVNLFVDLVSLAIIIKVLLSWIRGGVNKLTLIIDDIATPFIDLAKRITPNIGMIDLSPMIAILGLELIRSVLLIIIANI